MIEYPKQLYRSSYEDTVVVADSDEEQAARTEGYEMFAEIFEREGEFPAPVKEKRTRKAAEPAAEPAPTEAQ